MIASHTLILRYTPPTCTLEITAKTSPLSRWLKRQAIERLNFKLHFNDPKVPEERGLTIQGDRRQLEQLSDAVSNYVREFLNRSANRFPLKIGTETSLTSLSSKTNNQPKKARTSSTPSIKPMGLLAHELFLGSLATETSGEKIELSALQLFDLATALEEYDTEIATLPELNRSGSAKVNPIWGGTAAAIGLAVGLTAVGLKVFDRSPETKSTPSVALNSPSESEPDPVPQESAKTPEVPQPTPPVADKKPISSLPLPAPLASNNQLPPPPPIQEPSSLNSRVSVPDTTNIPSTPNLPPPAARTRSARPTTVIPKLPNLTPAPAKSSSDAADNSKSARSTPTQDEIATRTPSVNIPQLGEVKSYFQQRWQPPENLSETLQYRLILAEDGTIKRIIPIGKASAVYLDRTGIPLMGEPFVSAPEGNPTIRLVLNSDGTVQTFGE